MENVIEIHWKSFSQLLLAKIANLQVESAHRRRKRKQRDLETQMRFISIRLIWRQRSPKSSITVAEV